MIRVIDRRNKLSEARKVYYDKSAKDLPPLRLNQNVRIYNLNTSKWDTIGKVHCDENNSRSYRIETQNGNCIWRNRIFVKPIVYLKKKAKPTWILVLLGKLDPCRVPVSLSSLSLSVCSFISLCYPFMSLSVWTFLPLSFDSAVCFDLVWTSVCFRWSYNYVLLLQRRPSCQCQPL